MTMTTIHDSGTCTANDGQPCDMCVAAERRQSLKQLAEAGVFSGRTPNYLVAWRYEIDNSTMYWNAESQSFQPDIKRATVYTAEQQGQTVVPQNGKWVVTGAAPTAPPLTFTIQQLAAVRGAVLTVIDDGCNCDDGLEGRKQHPWEFYEDDRNAVASEDMATAQRMRFTDVVQTALMRRMGLMGKDGGK